MPAAGSGGTCDSGVYAYFTAGYVNSGGRWNEMNFGFHPDRDNHGTEVSCEHHDDKGGYHESTVKLGFNYRESFNTFVIKLRKDSLTWQVGLRPRLATAVLSFEGCLISLSHAPIDAFSLCPPGDRSATARRHTSSSIRSPMPRPHCRRAWAPG